jgi:UDP-N-acetyl-D-glucosamine dehydrogenase
MRSFTVPDLQSCELTAAYLEELDCAVICTDHSAFDYQMIADHASCVVDTRNAMAVVEPSKAKITKA